MKKTAFPAIVTMSLLAVGCTDSSDSQQEPEPVICPTYVWTEGIPLEEVAPQNVSHANSFAVDLFKMVYSSERKNFCISPASAFCTLAMMANGDEGVCRDEILTLLGYGKGTDGLHELNLYGNALMTGVQNLEGATQCGFTNSLWHHESFKVEGSFTQNLKGIYFAYDFPIWLGDEEGRKNINEFVEANTKGMIKDFLKEPLRIDLGILNTTYFKGTWKYQFDEHFTYNSIFYNADGTTSEAPYMLIEEDFDYYMNNDLTAVCMPYSGDRYTMTLIQPKDRSGFESMFQSLDGNKIDEITAGMQHETIDLCLPKFETETNLDIIDHLQELGLDKTCTLGLQNISLNPLVLTTFKHAAKIIVNEEGTEAGAASLGGMIESATGPEIKFIHFNHPFIYIIKDTISGTILFMGAITSF